MRIVDTHLHLVYQDRFTYPWLQAFPAIDRQWPVADYVAQAVPLGIEAALHMEVDVAEPQMEAETRFMIGVDPLIAGAIVAGRPEREDFPDYLERVLTIPGVKGMRRILHTLPDELSASALFAENLRRLGPAGLPFSLCLQARQLPIGLELVKRCPDVLFVLDHCGNPDVGAGALDPWRSDLKAMAAMPNVVAKISGIVASAKAGWTADDLRPFIEHVIACFGWNRVVWGSDYPVCTLTADLDRWLAATKEIVAGASKDEQAMLFSENAERIYGLAGVVA